MTTRADFVTQMYQAGIAAGLTDAAARVMASQAAVESTYGANAPGNNFFGIKAGSDWTGPTQSLWTHEVEGGQTVRVKQTFRVYATPADGIADRVAFMADKFPAFNTAATVGDAYDALQNGRFGAYATLDRPTYEGALNYVNATYLSGNPVPPADLPAVASELSTTPPARLNMAAALDNIKAQVTARQIALDSAASFGVRVPPGAPPPKAGDFVSGDFNQFGDAMNVLAPGIGALSDPRTSALLNGNTADPVGDGPVSWFGTPDLAPAGIGAPATAHADIAPVPMPGRPAALDAVPAVEAPVPMPGRPASLDAQPAAAAPPAQPAQIVHVGKHDYTVGDRFTQGGYNYEVTPAGITKIGKVDSGQPNLLDRIGGSVVAGMVTKAVDSAAPQVAKLATDAGAAISTNAGQIGDKVTTGIKAVPGLVAGLGKSIGNLFGGGGIKPSTADTLAAVIATGYAGEHFPVYEPAPAVVPAPARWGWSDVPAAPPPPPKLPAIVTAPVAPAVVPLTVDETRQEQTQARKLVPTTVSTATVKPPTGSVPTAPAPASTAVAPVFSGPVASRPAGAPQTKVIHVPNPEYSQWVSQQSVAPAIAGRVVGGDTRDLSDTPAAAPLDATAAPPEFIPKIVPVTPPPTPIAGRYTLQPGDTLSDVARRSGVSVSQIAADNGISDVNKIMAGSSIIVGSQNSIPVSAPSSRNSSAQQAAQQATAPTVQIASGKSAAVGSVSTSQDGRYSYQVQANGSILNTTTGRITSPATR